MLHMKRKLMMAAAGVLAALMSVRWLFSCGRT